MFHGWGGPQGEASSQRSFRGWRCQLRSSAQGWRRVRIALLRAHRLKRLARLHGNLSLPCLSSRRARQSVDHRPSGPERALAFLRSSARSSWWYRQPLSNRQLPSSPGSAGPFISREHTPCWRRSRPLDFPSCCSAQYAAWFGVEAHANNLIRPPKSTQRAGLAAMLRQGLRSSVAGLGRHASAAGCPEAASRALTGGGKVRVGPPQALLHRRHCRRQRRCRPLPPPSSPSATLC